MRLLTYKGPAIGIDLGTANIWVYLRNKGIVINEPSILAMDTNTQKVIAVGKKRRQCKDVLMQALKLYVSELAADIIERGLILSGGGALLPNLEKIIREATHLPLILAESPLECVAKGTEELNTLKKINNKKSELYEKNINY